MIEIINWQSNDIVEVISLLIRDKKLIPVFGSGFTNGCNAKNGTVPTGKQMSAYMSNFLAEHYGKSVDEYKNRYFSELCTLYNKHCPVSDKFNYFSDNFTEVILEDEKKAFLNLFSQYVYTLNIDDGIENNCRSFKVLLPNKEIFDEYIEKYQNVFKLHGDVHYYLKNIINESLIFNKKEYIESVKKNGKMLTKLKEDFADKNIMYIGCSLDDEPDLLSIVSEAVKLRRAECHAYYITTKDIDEEKQDLLEEYGITKIIKINNYFSFYNDITLKCEKLDEKSDFFDIYKEPNIVKLKKSETSINTLLDSNNLVPSPFEGTIYSPPFFINRNVSEEVLQSLKYVSPIHIIYGNRISGKTYFLVGLMDLIQDKTIYFFPSNVKFTDDRIDDLLEKTNCAFIFDTTTLTEAQMQKVIKLKSQLSSKHNYLVIAINSSERNGIDLISTTNKYGFTKVKNVFTNSELKDLNKKLQICNLPTFLNTERIEKYRNKSFYISRTILDNLYIFAEQFPKESQLPEFLKISKILTTKTVALLIVLATNKELSSYELSYYDIRKEAIQLVKDFPIHFEISYYKYSLPMVDSIYKLATNSRYFLLKYLGDFSKNKKQYELILKAYKYIYSCIFKNEHEFYRPRKMLNFLKFDVLNDVFYRNNNSTTGLIKYLYEGFEDELNTSPQFKHQRAKSITWLCSNDINSMLEAEKYINLARFDTESLLKSKNNDKLEISLDHIKYTQSIIYGRICSLEDFSKPDNVVNALSYYLDSLSSENNQLELEDIKKRKTYKYIYDDLYSLIDYVNSNPQNYPENAVKNCNAIVMLLRRETTSNNHQQN